MVVRLATEENLFHVPARAYVNPVNCVGVMGAGLALEFKRRFPDNFRLYEQFCRDRRLKPGEVFITSFGDGPERRYIVNLATKNHYSESSSLEVIKRGIDTLVRISDLYTLESIAIPAIGCGLGGLDWFDVYPLLHCAFEDKDEVDAILFAPRA